MNATIIAVAYAVMALGLNIVVGFAGLLDLGYVAFYALGAYSVGWFASGFFFKARVHVLVSPVQRTLAGVHLNFILVLAGAALICALAGMLIGLPTLRLRGDYIAIVTLAFGVMIPLVIALGWFINRTRAGRAMRATAQDPEAARLMGINVNATISLTFLLGGMLAGAAGLVYALYQTNIWFFQGFKAGLIAFTAAVMGGIGNVRGAVLGGLIIGVIQALADARLGPQWTEAVVFAYLIAIMILRPRGLHGEETREAG